jgi:hypothetical protein
MLDVWHPIEVVEFAAESFPARLLASQRLPAMQRVGRPVQAQLQSARTSCTTPCDWQKHPAPKMIARIQGTKN